MTETTLATFGLRGRRVRILDPTPQPTPLRRRRVIAELSRRAALRRAVTLSLSPTC